MSHKKASALSHVVHDVESFVSTDLASLIYFINLEGRLILLTFDVLDVNSVRVIICAEDERRPIFIETKGSCISASAVDEVATLIV